MPNADLELATLCSSKEGNECFGTIIHIYDIEISYIATIGCACGVDWKVSFGKGEWEVSLELNSDVGFQYWRGWIWGDSGAWLNISLHCHWNWVGDSLSIDNDSHCVGLTLTDSSLESFS